MTQQTDRTGPRQREPAREVFRQFAWNLAGTLAKTGGTERAKPTPRTVRRAPRKPAGGGGR